MATLPGYGPDIDKNREEARKIMEKAGYGPDKRLAVKVSVRNTPPFRDPAVILIDQLREIYINGELETVESATWFPKVYRKDYKIGLNLTGRGSTIPMHSSTKITPAARTAITPATAIPKSTSCSISSRWSRIRKNAGGSFGKSIKSCRRMAPARSFSTTASRHAGNPS